ncbi:MAG: hypothetical protein WKG07_12430 [Hymenobacter sp.]
MCPWWGVAATPTSILPLDAKGDTRQHFSILKGQRLFLIMQWSDSVLYHQRCENGPGHVPD